jgi:electron transfer flavoprotein beta subunit
MKVLVAVKRVMDANIFPRVKADGSGVDLTGIKMAINPFDEIAVEEAVRLKEAGRASEVVLVSTGLEAAKETIRNGLAMGADRGLLVVAQGPVEPLAVAKVLRAVIAAETPDLVLLGKQAIDDDCSQTGQMLAALLGWPQATCASKLEPLDGSVRVTREIDGGLEVLQLGLPAVITVDLRLNTPRFASMPNIIKSRSKPIAVQKAEDFGVDISPRLDVLETRAPERRKAGVRLGSVAELVDRLANEAEVI